MAFPVLEKNSAKTKESKQAFVGQPRNACLGEQRTNDMLWIRAPFLESETDHGYIVVHGHTQTEEPDVKKNRIGTDTGAARPKTLTAVALSRQKPPRFLSVSEDR